MSREDVDYTSARSVISALQDKSSTVDLSQIAEGAIEDVARWVRAQPGLEELKQFFFEACLHIRPPSDFDQSGLTQVDPDAAAALFEAMRKDGADASSLLYPLLVMLQDQHRSEVFPESLLYTRLSGVPGNDAEELEVALQELQSKGILVRYPDGDLRLLQQMEICRTDLKTYSLSSADACACISPFGSSPAPHSPHIRIRKLVYKFSQMLERKDDPPKD